MTQYSQLIRPDNGQDAVPIHCVSTNGFEQWSKSRSARERTAMAAHRFKAEPATFTILPGEGDSWSVVAGVEDGDALSTWCLAKLSETLPAGTYKLANGHPGAAVFGWLMGQYKFTRYLEAPSEGPRVLLTDEPAKIDQMVMLAEATALVRDLVNTPPVDCGPPALEAEAERIAKAHGGSVEVTRGDALETGYPLVHAVGQAAMREHAPRLIELRWGREDNPKLAIIGKGVVFDSGGLDVKSSTGMRLMKKDMGGSAHALALAELVMKANLPVRLHMLVPAVENAISGNALRPGDVITARSGTTVEIDNTDAEGRLILADALTKAGEDNPELVIDFATLTGAARVALGPDLPAMFANGDALATGLTEGGETEGDPLWRLPLWDGYMEMLSSDIADCVNSASGGFAGSITAALFLKKFAPEKADWAHFDTFAWRPSAKPGRPKGGEALGLRASFRYLKNRYG